MKSYFYTCILFFLLICNKSYSQSNSLFGSKKVLLLGESMLTYMHDSSQSQLRDIRFHLLPLVEVTDKALLVTEIGVETFGGSPVLTLEQVQLCYQVAPN